MSDILSTSWQWYDYIWVGLVLYCVFSPTKYDPAIRLKYWLMNKKFGDR